MYKRKTCSADMEGLEPAGGASRGGGEGAGASAAQQEAAAVKIQTIQRAKQARRSSESSSVLVAVRETAKAVGSSAAAANKDTDVPAGVDAEAVVSEGGDAEEVVSEGGDDGDDSDDPDMEFPDANTDYPELMFVPLKSSEPVVPAVTFVVHIVMLVKIEQKVVLPPIGPLRCLN